MDGRTSFFADYCVIARTPSEEEQKRNDRLIDHYSKTNFKTELQRLRNNLKLNYLDKYPEHVANPKLKLFASYVPFLASMGGVRTNHEYAKKAWLITSFILILFDHDYENNHYYLLNGLEKLLKLYDSYASDKVSGFVATLFEALLDVTLPIKKTEFDKMKLTLSQRFGVKDEQPEFQISEGVISSLSILSPAEYLQALSTWKEVAYGYDQPRPTAS